MKKLVLIFLCLFIFTGCNSKHKLTCKKEEKNAGYDYFETYELVYENENDNLKQINLTMKSEYNEFYTEDEINEEYDEAVEYCDFYSSSSNNLIECDPTLEDATITIKIKIKVEKISDELFEEMMYVTKNEINNLKETNDMLENVGYSCS